MQGRIKRVSRARLSPRTASKKPVRPLRYGEEKTGGDSDRRGWIKGKLEGGVIPSPRMTKRTCKSRQTSAIVVRSVATESVASDYLVAGTREGTECKEIEDGGGTKSYGDADNDIVTYARA